MFVKRITVGERCHAFGQFRAASFELVGQSDRDDLADLAEVRNLEAASRERAGADPQSACDHRWPRVEWNGVAVDGDTDLIQTILSLLAIGGDGVISVTSHVCARELALMVKAFDAGDLAAAQALSRKTSPLANHLFFRSNPIPVKTALALRGQAGGPITARFRLPLCPLSDGETAELQKRLLQSGWL